MKKFENGQTYTFTIDGVEYTKKVTKVNGKSIYFGKVRVPYEADEDGMYLVTDLGKVYAQEEADVENPVEEVEEVQNENKEEVTMLNNEEYIEIPETVCDDPNTVEEAINRAEEKLDREDAQAKTSYIVVKSTRNGKKLFGDLVHVQEGQTIDEVINPLHADENPTFVALVRMDKVLAFIRENVQKGLTQTARNITKKYNKIFGETGPEIDYDTVWEILNTIKEFGSWTWETPNQVEEADENEVA